MRFIKLSSKLQMLVAGGAVALAGLWFAAIAVMAFRQYRTETDLASFAEQKVRVASAEERLKAYGGNLGRVVDDLRERQDLLETMVRMLPDDIASEEGASDTVTDSSTAAKETVRKVGALIPQARGLAEIEARQLALVERVTRYADARARRAEAAIRKLNLDPKAMSRQTHAAMGGPFRAFTGGSSIDPRFERLGLSLTRMAVLERALNGIPHVVPAGIENITSSFGYRRDPFNGLGAMHSGIDFRGALGSPIFAAADGRVTFAGRKSAYGNAIEVRHGNGILTRYAHLSRIGVKVGQLVEGGATIGGLGTSGRSTGPHLHFEVHINDHAVNPRPFLEVAPDVLKEVRRPGSGRSTPAASRQLEK